jgi:Lrp/AsnC family transcriptional regulator, regulator for asnA, asnC and gidA
MSKSRIDATDAELIHCLQEDPRASLVTIARTIGVSESTVKRRLDALINDRVISPAIIIDPRLLGYGSSAVLLIDVTPKHIMDAADALCAMPEVGYLALSLGQFDIMTYVIQKSPGDLIEFVTQRISALPGVLNVETVTTPKFLKVFSGWKIPIDYDPTPDVSDEKHHDQEALEIDRTSGEAEPTST